MGISPVGRGGVMNLFLICFPSSTRRQTSELGVTEHVEGDPCKFALWVGRTPTSDNKIVLKVRHDVTTLHVSHAWQAHEGI